VNGAGAHLRIFCRNLDCTQGIEGLFLEAQVQVGGPWVPPPFPPPSFLLPSHCQTTSALTDRQCLACTLLRPIPQAAPEFPVLGTPTATPPPTTTATTSHICQGHCNEAFQSVIVAGSGLPRFPTNVCTCVLHGDGVQYNLEMHNVHIIVEPKTLLSMQVCGLRYFFSPSPLHPRRCVLHGNGVHVQPQDA